MADTRRSDGVEPGSGPSGAAPPDPRSPRRPSVPRTFQSRLTVAFIGVVALTLGMVAPVVINRLDDYFRQQEEQSLRDRTQATAAVLERFITDAVGDQPVVARRSDETLALNPQIRTLLVDQQLLTLAADYIAQADIRLTFGAARTDTDGTLVVDPDPSLAFEAALDVRPVRGQARDPAISPTRADRARTNRTQDWGMSVVLSNPYTSRASTLAAITGLLLIMGIIAFVVAMLVAAFIAHRFTTPLTRLTEASRRLAEGDFASRVPAEELSSGTLELRALSQQFNTMADRLEESVTIIRRDRDYSRDLLADVSHELRTPIAAMRTFIELLQGPAGRDASARAEFLDSSAVQLDRLDWLAQNLLELSKLDSGLVLLDLRPDDVRGTIESAVQQQAASAERRGIGLSVAPARQPAPDPARPAPRRPGDHEPGRQRDQVHQSRWHGPGHARARSPTAGRRSRSPTRASASAGPSCPGSSTASSAAPRPTRRAARGRGSACRSSSRSSTCTGARSLSRAGSGTGRGSWSACLAIHASRPTARVAGTPHVTRAGLRRRRRSTILHRLRRPR